VLRKNSIPLALDARSPSCDNKQKQPPMPQRRARTASSDGAGNALASSRWSAPGGAAINRFVAEQKSHPNLPLDRCSHCTASTGFPAGTSVRRLPLAGRELRTRRPTLVSRVPSLRSQYASVIQRLTAGLRLLGATAIRGSWGSHRGQPRRPGAGVQRYTRVDGALRWLALPALARRECPAASQPPENLGTARSGSPAIRFARQQRP
jgi:hypothetical protein